MYRLRRGVLPAGDVTEVTVDLSKDNVFLGVRAVDRAGHHSPVAFPKPGSWGCSVRRRRGSGVRR